jgi:hypothetical protein
MQGAMNSGTPDTDLYQDYEPITPEMAYLRLSNISNKYPKLDGDQEINDFASLFVQEAQKIEYEQQENLHGQLYTLSDNPYYYLLSYLNKEKITPSNLSMTMPFTHECSINDNAAFLIKLRSLIEKHKDQAHRSWQETLTDLNSKLSETRLNSKKVGTQTTPIKMFRLKIDELDNFKQQVTSIKQTEALTAMHICSEIELLKSDLEKIKADKECLKQIVERVCNQHSNVVITLLQSMALSSIDSTVANRFATSENAVRTIRQEASSLHHALSN